MKTPLKLLPILALAIACGQGPSSAEAEETKNETAEAATPWNTTMEEIRAQIVAPTFPDKDFVITDFGAVNDSTVKSTDAFKKAIAACNEAGGGRVVVPNGTFLTGAIHLKSNVNLHLEDDARILFSRDTADYLPVVFTRWEGMELMNYSPFIYAYEQENIAITGNGIIDGNATMEHWWWWCGAKHWGWKEGMGHQRDDRALLHELNHKEVPARERVFGPGSELRPQFIQPYKCKNVLISGVTLHRSPMWNLHPVLCENVTIENVKVITLGPNNDGCDPESCKNVLIKDCYFDTGDDCIAIKSGRNNDGRNIGKPSENMIIEGCEMKNGHGGVVIGSEISGGARNIFAQNCIMDSPGLDRVLRIKTSSKRGGTVENIYMRDVEVGTYKDAAIRCNMYYEEPGEHMPTIKNVHVENLTVENGGRFAVLVRAYEESPVENLTLKNCTINGVDEPVSMDNYKDVVFENVVINGKAYNLPEKTEE